MPARFAMAIAESEAITSFATPKYLQVLHLEIERSLAWSYPKFCCSLPLKMVCPIIWDLVLKSLIENVSRYLQSNQATPKFSFLLKFSSVVSGVFAVPIELLETVAGN